MSTLKPAETLLQPPKTSPVDSFGVTVRDSQESDGGDELWIRGRDFVAEDTVGQQKGRSQCFYWQLRLLPFLVATRTN